MLRTWLAASIVLAVGLCASARETSPCRAAQPADGKKTPPGPENRGKIIEDLKSDYGNVMDKLGKNNIDTQLRARQLRIVENLQKLLEDDDSPPPPGAENHQPKPPASNAEPAPPPANAPAEQKSRKRPTEGVQGQRDFLPRTPEELQKDPSRPGGWGDFPKRLRPEMGVFAQDRFPPRYEELLRAYYRNLAESGRRDGNE